MSLMYGADGLPVMLDQSWFSIRMRNTVWMGQAPVQVPGSVVVVVLAVVEVVEGHVNGLQVNAQLISPTSHCAILRASSMLQAPSPLTSRAEERRVGKECRSRGWRRHDKGIELDGRSLQKVW